MEAILCAICGNERAGMLRDHDGQQRPICDECEHTHPRTGRYSFDGGSDGLKTGFLRNPRALSARRPR